MALRRVASICQVVRQASRGSASAFLRRTPTTGRRRCSRSSLDPASLQGCGAERSSHTRRRCRAGKALTDPSRRLVTGAACTSTCELAHPPTIPRPSMVRGPWIWRARSSRWYVHWATDHIITIGPDDRWLVLRPERADEITLVDPVAGRAVTLAPAETFDEIVRWRGRSRGCPFSE